MSNSLQPRESSLPVKGFFTDTTLCIGCKACEVACKQWNQLPDDGFLFSGMSYDNTIHLGASTWRHVAFIERPVPLSTQDAGAFSWLFSSDVCKHCARAGCLESCPTGAIIRAEYGNVYVQPDVCNGCGYCIVNCPFGVIDRREEDGRAWKCTLCYDRLRADMPPACAKACPTESIKFGNLADLREVAQKRVEALHEKGLQEAYLYGESPDAQPGTEGLNAFFLLVDKPEVYNLPPDPVVPTKTVKEAWRAMAWGAAGMVMAALGAVFFGHVKGAAYE
jgi:formate dehydrogenase iron-sulfur subunit